MTTIIRVCDVETTGMEPTDEVVEIGAVDLIDGLGIKAAGSELVKPERPIPAAARAIHHISDAMTADARSWGEVWPGFLSADVAAFAAHKASFDSQWLTDSRRSMKPMICTWKCAMRQWPDAPGFSNQCLRYFLGTEIGAEAEPVHRALPDAVVTAHILAELLRHNPVETLIEWSAEPAVYPVIGFGKHRGAKWSEPPDDYLSWLIGAKDMGADVVWNARREIARRQDVKDMAAAAERKTHVSAAINAVKTAIAVCDLESWWRAHSDTRAKLSIIPGSDEYFEIARACADRKAELEKSVS